MDNYLPISDAARKIRVPNVSFGYACNRSLDSKRRDDEWTNPTPRKRRNVTSRENFTHLDGIPIGISEAARKYKIPRPTLSRWKDKGYIRVIGQRGQKILLDEGDVAFCCSVQRRTLARENGPGKKRKIKQITNRDLTSPCFLILLM